MNDTTTTKETLKVQATTLLHRYDTMRKDMRTLEKDLHKAVTAYGKTTGRWGFNKDHFRIELQMEQEAERDAWEKHNG